MGSTRALNSNAPPEERAIQIVKLRERTQLENRMLCEATNEFPMGEFIAAVLTVEADGVEIDSQFVRWNSTVFPGPGSGTLTADKLEVRADGQDFAIVTVTATQIGALGGGPAVGAYVELTNGVGVVLNESLDLEPLQGFDGFRTNAAGEWKARVRSSTPGFLVLTVKVDGRALILPSSRLIIFQ